MFGEKFIPVENLKDSIFIKSITKLIENKFVNLFTTTIMLTGCGSQVLNPVQQKNLEKGLSDTNLEQKDEAFPRECLKFEKYLDAKKLNNIGVSQTEISEVLQLIKEGSTEIDFPETINNQKVTHKELLPFLDTDKLINGIRYYVDEQNDKHPARSLVDFEQASKKMEQKTSVKVNRVNDENIANLVIHFVNKDFSNQTAGRNYGNQSKLVTSPLGIYLDAGIKTKSNIYINSALYEENLEKQVKEVEATLGVTIPQSFIDKSEDTIKRSIIGHEFKHFSRLPHLSGTDMAENFSCEISLGVDDENLKDIKNIKMTPEIVKSYLAEGKLKLVLKLNEGMDTDQPSIYDKAIRVQKLLAEDMMNKDPRFSLNTISQYSLEQ